ncbi:LytTR family DNA-binding domain-containing protein [Spirosoma sp.]|uniref:LytTR family DNA-binding domain-containing protein n=1 Tax=Spirosoma sp. TaxID=1899569 RepID=UPI003B3B4B37
MAPIANPLIDSIKIPGCPRPVSLTTIIRLQGDGNYTRLHLQTHTRPLLVAKSLKWFEELLPGFVRVHKSDLINPSFVQMLDYHNAKTLEVRLPDKQIIKVSRRRIDPVLIKLKHHAIHMS